MCTTPDCGTTKSWQVCCSIMILGSHSFHMNYYLMGALLVVWYHGCLIQVQVGRPSFLRCLCFRQSAKTNWDHPGSKGCRKQVQEEGINLFSTPVQLDKPTIDFFDRLNTIKNNYPLVSFKNFKMYFKTFMRGQVWRRTENVTKTLSFICKVLKWLITKYFAIHKCKWILTTFLTHITEKLFWFTCEPCSCPFDIPSCQVI